MQTQESANDKQQHLESLAALEIKVSPEIIVQNIEEKLHLLIPCMRVSGDKTFFGIIPNNDVLYEIAACHVLEGRAEKNFNDPCDLINWARSERAPGEYHTFLKHLDFVTLNPEGILPRTHYRNRSYAPNPSSDVLKSLENQPDPNEHLKTLAYLYVKEFTKEYVNTSGDKIQAVLQRVRNLRKSLRNFGLMFKTNYADYGQTRNTPPNLASFLFRRDELIAKIQKHSDVPLPHTRSMYDRYESAIPVNLLDAISGSLHAYLNNKFQDGITPKEMRDYLKIYNDARLTDQTFGIIAYKHVSMSKISDTYVIWDIIFKKDSPVIDKAFCQYFVDSAVNSIGEGDKGRVKCSTPDDKYFIISTTSMVNASAVERIEEHELIHKYKLNDTNIYIFRATPIEVRITYVPALTSITGKSVYIDTRRKVSAITHKFVKNFGEYTRIPRKNGRKK